MKKIPVLLVGRPGVGKSASVFTKYGRECVSCEILSGWQAEDILGIPVRSGGEVKRLRPDWHVRLTAAENAAREKGKTACLFFDEIDKARREVADACLSLISDRQIGGWGLADSTDIILAANPPEWGGAEGVSDALRTRCIIREVVPNVREWCDWVAQNYQGNQAAAVIEAIAAGKLPLIDTYRDESGAWDKARDVSPRTWALALEVLTSEKNPEQARKDVAGLLTPAISEAACNIFFAQIPDIQSAAMERNAIAAKKARKPARV